MAYELANARVYQGFEFRIGNERKSEIEDFDTGWPYAREVSMEKDCMKNSWLVLALSKCRGEASHTSNDIFNTGGVGEDVEYVLGGFSLLHTVLYLLFTILPFYFFHTLVHAVR